jgi:folate-binding protein YgfZ
MSNAAPALLRAFAAAWRVVAVEGRDARAFLQGQLTQDLAALDADRLAIAGLLSAQGRVIAVPWLRASGESIELIVPADLSEAVLMRLKRYVLRAKAQLSARDLDAAAADAMARHVGADAALTDPALALVRAGQPLIVAANTEEWIPQMINLDLVGGISFTKGCYTGQEIVARTQHLGRIKRRMFRYAAAGAPPPPKSALLADGQKVGEVVTAAQAAGGCELVAVINLDARDRPLSLEQGDRASPLSLPYPIP